MALSIGTIGLDFRKILLGVGLAQLISAGGYIILGWFLSPANFGLFSIWFGMTNILGILISGRFDQALVIENLGEDREKAVWNVLVTIFLVALILIPILVILSYIFSQNVSEYPIFILTIIPAGLSIALINTWQTWLAADGAVGKLNQSRLLIAVVTAVFQILAAIWFSTPESIAVAFLFAQATSLILIIWMQPLSAVLKPTWQSQKVFWCRYMGFLLFLFPSSIVGGVSAQVPLILISLLFGAEQAGYFALVFRVIGLPLAVIGRALTDVLRRHAAQELRDTGQCYTSYKKVFMFLLPVSVVGGLALYVLGETAFSFVFGQQWAPAGTLSVLLIPYFSARMIASPLSYILIVTEKQKYELAWQVGLLACVTLAIWLPTEFRPSMLAYAWSTAVCYTVYIFLSLMASKNRL